MTLWRLLARYQIPTFLFINKMDQDGTDKEKLLAELKKRLSDNCADFTWENTSGIENSTDETAEKAEDEISDLQSRFLEDISVCDEELLEKTGGIIQGMSGSPILQNGKLIGAVTHVFVMDSTKGYGIFAETMLEQLK
mgnify:CR=1 FL=1